MLNRLPLILAVFGMLVSLHLWIQKERDFDQGCWGIAGAATPVGVDCRDPDLKRVGTVAGVSTAAAGYFFYLGLALLGFGRLLGSPVVAKRCYDVTDVALATATPYTFFLIYFQAFRAKAFCPLCLVASGVLAALLLVRFLQYRRGGFQPTPDSLLLRETAYACTTAFAGMGLMIAVVLFVNRVGLRPTLGEGVPAQRRETLPIKVEDWVTADTPSLETATGPVVIAFFDPNCPHCDKSFAMMRSLAKRYKDHVRFVVFPRPLWKRSMLQVQALELARREGRYHEMWEAQFAQEKRSGLGQKEIEALFRQLSLNTDRLAERLAALEQPVQAQLEKAKRAGINSTPSIYLDGAPVGRESSSENGLAALLDATIERRDQIAPVTAPLRK